MKKIILAMFFAPFLFACNNEQKKGEAVTTETETTKGKAPVELLMDSSLVASATAAFTAFENKNIDGYTASLADNVMFRWSGGDSLAGKQAVKDYYSGRFNIIDKIKFSEYIFLPVMANVSPNGVVPGGKWLLSWYRVDVTYKNSKSIVFYAHNTQHYNDAGKIDLFNQYIDRHPLMEATKDIVK
jgi:SnoaL-like domain